jgi:hypothetical protein
VATALIALKLRVMRPMRRRLTMYSLFFILLLSIVYGGISSLYINEDFFTIETFNYKAWRASAATAGLLAPGELQVLRIGNTN